MSLIRIYNGGGASYSGPRILKKRFEQSGFTAEFISAEEIQEGIQTNTSLLAFGGQTVTGFKNALKPIGIKHIQDYVHSGGHYLGICAGGYWGGLHTRFKGKNPITGKIYKLESEGLGFYPGYSYGSLTSISRTPFTGLTDSAAVITLTTPEQESFRSLYWGGGHFVTEQNNTNLKNIRTLGIYDKGPYKAYTMGVHTTVGTKGGQATLLGYHPEIDLPHLEKWILPDENLAPHTARLFQEAYYQTDAKGINDAFSILLKQINLKPDEKKVGANHNFPRVYTAAAPA